LKIGILTGGGDCPGLNAVIRAVTQTAINEFGAEVIGIEDGFEGLVDGRFRALSERDVRGIIGLGGTILGTSNRGDPWHYPVRQADGRFDIQDRSGDVLRNFKQMGLDVLIATGGDGTMNIAKRLIDHGMPVIGVPKTIDNDLSATDQTFGFDTASQVVCEAIDRLSTTAASHQRVMVIEVMGRYAGWIALNGGMAGGADMILIPEIAFSWASVFERLDARHKNGHRFSIVCVAEGAHLPEGGEVVRELDHRRTDAKQLGGIGAVVAKRIEEGTGIETRVTVLGHLQRGGSPTAFDRLLATRYGAAAARHAGRRQFGVMMSAHHGEIRAVPIKDAIAKTRTVEMNDELVLAAHSIGVSFGNE
jgi:ATP-dependent phosphofructokinase / diphosphate-dependent phosphofructokinase